MTAYTKTTTNPNVSAALLDLLDVARYVPLDGQGGTLIYSANGTLHEYEYEARHDELAVVTHSTAVPMLPLVYLDTNARPDLHPARSRPSNVSIESDMSFIRCAVLPDDGESYSFCLPFDHVFLSEVWRHKHLAVALTAEHVVVLQAPFQEMPHQIRAIIDGLRYLERVGR